ncbi:unnamed protein product [Bursaphelenchus xylophilus]|uniref:(pine wood nematode) hypothetical protein n=1 Tax=Bursaphelenchus xylophilus TaxID=6326 RepID=A0A1I7STI0_BURXY|nr:unnamed protein product [Bursaphelenchus xylophilus]CAG9108392.1 unnamed protein product [Bursaphelenchus xylophilus]
MALNSTLEYNTDQIKRDGINDPAMKYFYLFNDLVINLFSNRPFPQEILIDQDFINLDVVKSTRNNHHAWLLHEKWWLLMEIVLIVGSLFFTLVYIFYKCCMCCCGSNKEEVDGRFDGCKRNFLNLIFLVLVTLNIFASVAVLLCSQYATLSVEKFPSVLTWFGDDLEMYKNYNNQLADEIIENDWKITKDELKSSLHNTGHLVVTRLYDKGSKDLISQLNKIDSATVELINLNNDQDFLDLITFLSENNTQIILTSEQTNMIKRLRNVLPKLSQISQLKSLNETIDKSAMKIQMNINRYVEDISQRIDEEDSTIQDVQLKIKKELDSLDFTGIHEEAKRLSKLFDDNKQYFNIGWALFLGIAAVLFFISLCFLFGVFYGICGRRASYYNDDCCVRPTGGKFYGCGVSMAILVLFVLAVVASSLMLIFANATDLICDTWEHPEDRMEMIDLIDRITYEKLINTRTETDMLAEVLGKKTNIKKLIKGCRNGTTFVQMLGIRDRYKSFSLFNDKVDEFSKLGDNIRNSFESDIEKVDLNVTEIEHNISQLKALSTINLTEVKSNPMLKPYLPTIEKIDKALKKLSSLPSHESLGFAQNTLSNKEELSKFLDAVIVEETNSVKGIVTKYFSQLQDSLESQITSCEPISHIMDNMRVAVCDHTLDPLNGIWMSLVISVVLFIPLIMMANTLARLYNHAAPFTKYTVHEPHTEAAFTTDDYAMTMNPNKPSYGTRNYGYQDVYPPPYLNDQYRYRY